MPRRFGACACRGERPYRLCAGFRRYSAPAVRWCMQPGESSLFGRERGCEEFEQRILRFDSPSDARGTAPDDEVLYVLAGTGRATIGGEQTELTAGTAAWVAAGSHWRIDEAAGLEILSVPVRQPLPANGTTHAVIAAEDRLE